MDTLAYIKKLQDRSSLKLKSCLSKPGLSPRLEDAIHYAVHNGGKRIRPVLAYASAETLSGSLEDADHCACAVELIHAYSLIHDDLPAMDNDDLRRGQPTCHIKYDEATAILAGDALQSLAFALLAQRNEMKTDPVLSLEMVSILAEAVGWRGMVAGQSLDIDGSGLEKKETDLALMHSLKTGALITASIKLGALSSGRASSEQLTNLETFGHCIGLAFQIKDDLLDVEGDTEILGKQQGKDQALNRSTYPAILGMDGASKRMMNLFDEGNDALTDFGEAADRLKGIALFIIDRKH